MTPPRQDDCSRKKKEKCQILSERRKIEPNLSVGFSLRLRELMGCEVA